MVSNMVLYRRKRSYRRKSVLKRLTKPRKTTAIQTLAKQIQSIKSSMRKEKHIINYSAETPGGTIGTQLAGPVTTLNLSYMSSWNNVFGSGTDDENNPDAIWKSFGLDMKFASYNEFDTINFTVFLVKCKDSMAPYVNLGTGAVTLTAGTHYVDSYTGGTNAYANGLVMVNKKFFDIVKIRRFSLGNYQTTTSSPAAQTQFGTDRRMYFKVALNIKISNPSGSWKGTGCPQDPSSVYLLMVFNNNSTADAESPRLTYNVVHTVQI